MNKQRIKEIRERIEKAKDRTSKTKSPFAMTEEEAEVYFHSFKDLPDALDYTEKIETERDEAVRVAVELRGALVCESSVHSCGGCGQAIRCGVLKRTIKALALKIPTVEGK